MSLVNKVIEVLRKRHTQFEVSTPAIIDSEAGDWFESNLTTAINLRHHAHGHAMLIVYEGSSSDELPTVTMIGGEDWTELQAAIGALFKD